MIKPYKLFENDELRDALDDLNRNLKILKSYGQYQNRKRLVNKDKLGDIADDFKAYFYDLTDEGWQVLGDWDPKFYFDIRIKKFLSKDGIESEFKNIVDRMSEVRDRLEDEGFQSKFIIYFNGKAQQIQNPDSYRVPLYKFTGIGDTIGAEYFRRNGYDPNDYFLAEIEYAIV